MHNCAQLCTHAQVDESHQKILNVKTNNDDDNEDDDDDDNDGNGNDDTSYS